MHNVMASIILLTKVKSVHFMPKSALHYLWMAGYRSVSITEINNKNAPRPLIIRNKMKKKKNNYAVVFGTRQLDKVQLIEIDTDMIKNIDLTTHIHTIKQALVHTLIYTFMVASFIPSKAKIS